MLYTIHYVWSSILIFVPFFDRGSGFTHVRESRWKSQSNTPISGPTRVAHNPCRHRLCQVYLWMPKHKTEKKFQFSFWSAHTGSLLNYCVAIHRFRFTAVRRGYFPLPVLFRNWGEKGFCKRRWWDKCCTRCIVKSSLLTFMKEYLSFIELNFEYVHKITSLCGNLSYKNLFISCHFRVEMIFVEATEFNKRNLYLQLWLCLP